MFSVQEKVMKPYYYSIKNNIQELFPMIVYVSTAAPHVKLTTTGNAKIG